MPYLSHNKILSIIAISCLLVGFYSCANIVMPRGGPVDETPPEIVSITPSDSNVNIKPKKIEIRTNKYMEVKDLDRQLTFSPVIDVKPTVVSYGKRIEIKLVDSLLKPNTTYKLSLGNALVDNRENTPIENFNYVFSTGAYFDSLQVKGNVYSILTGKPDSTAAVLLYEADISDSAMLFTKPTYYAKVQSDGTFNLDLLPNRPFKLIAITDEDQNMLYTRVKEAIAFTDTLVQPTLDYNRPLTLYTFTEEDTSGVADSLKKVQEASSKGRFDAAVQRNRDNKNLPPYIVAVDTNLKERTFDVTDTLRIKLNAPIKSLDKDKISLFYTKNNIDAQSVVNVIQTDDELKLVSEWQEDLIYTLRLVKGWATDTTDAEVLPGKYTFRTKSKDDYATLRVNFDSSYVNSIYNIVVINQDKPQDTLLHEKLGKLQYEFKYLNPGTYLVYLYEDKNLDGKWTTGSFSDKRQPEKILNNRSPIVLRKGWENETDFIYVDETEKRNSRAEKKL